MTLTLIWTADDERAELALPEWDVMQLRRAAPTAAALRGRRVSSLQAAQIATELGRDHPHTLFFWRASAAGGLVVERAG